MRERIFVCMGGGGIGDEKGGGIEDGKKGGIEDGKGGGKTDLDIIKT